MLFLEVKGANILLCHQYRSPSLEQDVLSLVSSLLLKLTKMVRSTMAQKPSVQWRNTHCHITDSRDLTKEFTGRDPLSPICIAYSCGTLFSQVGFLMPFVALFRYMCTLLIQSPCYGSYFYLLPAPEKLRKYW